jgi:oxygen-independent coproporphyrinogen-3 oxidase
MSSANPPASASGLAAATAEPWAGSYFVATYPPFSTWDALCVDRLRRRLAESRAASAPLGFYLHVPFCIKRCRYCYYLSRDDRPALVERYLEALARELASWTAAPALSGCEPSFVYVGGGTPSLLSARRIRRMLGGFRERVSCAALREMTFECAPRSVTAEKLEALREMGVTRISLGVQQLDDDVLGMSGRVHRVRDVIRAYAAIAASGFPVVNVDLMAGLPGETDASFAGSLDRVIAMGPDSVTIYPLEIPHNTPLYRSIRDGSEPSGLAGWDVKRARLASGLACLESSGYTLRSAYAAVRDPARHGFLYQDQQYRGANLIGLGASAFSYLDGIHAQNHCRLEDYLDAAEREELPLHRGRALTVEERLVREFVLRLKLGGVEAEPLREKYRIDPIGRLAEPLSRFARDGWLRFDSGGVTLTREGLLRVDRLIPGFYLPEHRGLRYS